MGAIDTLKQAIQSKWIWLWQCWTLRLDVKELVEAFQRSPTHVQVEKLEQRIAILHRGLEAEQKAISDLEKRHQESSQKHQDEYAKLKLKYDQRLRATETDQVIAVKRELMAERDQKHLLTIELIKLREQMAEHMKEHQMAKDGNRALVQFIHKRHRLNVKIDPNSIKAALQKADQNA